MFGKNRSQNADRTWREVEELIEGLNVLAAPRYGGDREFYMFTDGKGCRMTLKTKGAEYSGKGQDPWECARDLASNAGSISSAVERVITHR